MITPLNFNFAVLARLAAASVMTAGFVAGAVAAPASAHPKETIDYVALGDSYSAGIGAGVPQAPCGVSDLGFASLLDGKKAVDLMENASCGGAVTTDIPAQAAALTEDTDLVTITVGGNDLKYSTVVGICLGLIPVPAGQPDCDGSLMQAELLAEGPLTQSLKSTFAVIAAQAPHAHVVVMGYPHLFSPKFDRLGADAAAAEKMNDATTVLNDVLESAADNADFQYVDVTKEFRNHGIGAPDPWIHGVFADAALHPTAEGYKKGYFKAFKSEVQLSKIQKKSHSYK
ncbi:SGNH/GDSL hydrolase family protein [Arthrobacter monumenti]